MGDITRINGMASGLDVDTLVKGMMKPYNAQVDKAKQDKDALQWKQDAYRDTLADINTFKSSYFDVLNSGSYMLSKNAYSNFDIQSSVQPAGNFGATVTANTGAITGNYKVEVTKLATPSKIEGVAFDHPVTNATKIFGIGVKNTIILKLTANSATNATEIKIPVDENTTIGDVVTAINSGSGGSVVAKYSEISNKFSLQTVKTGENAKLNISGDSNTKDLFAKLNITLDGTNSLNGMGAGNGIVKITPPGGADATSINNENNTFSLDGVNFNVTNASTNSITTVNIVSNAQKTVDKIKDFVTKYNELISKINGKLDEKKSKEYLPLTDDQKKGMSADDIKSWETKAKVGLLRGDSDLKNMLNEMRSAFFKDVSGVEIKLKDIGIDTTADYTQRGKLVINEAKLKEAIVNKGDQVAKLFTNSSSKSYVQGTANSERSGEEGILQKIADIINDYAGTMGSKGALLKKAGVKGDFTEFNNLLTNQLKEKNKRISDLKSKLSSRESAFYAKFTKLEKAMQNSNAQSSWLSQQVGSK